MSLRTRVSAFGQGTGLHTPELVSYNSPRHNLSPRHGPRVKKTFSKVIFLQGSALLLLLMVGIWCFASFSANPEENAAALDPNCPDCGHRRSTKADYHSSDLSIKLARGRKDLYQDDADDGTARYSSSISSHAKASEHVDSMPAAAQQLKPAVHAANSRGRNDSYRRSGQQQPQLQQGPQQRVQQQQQPQAPAIPQPGGLQAPIRSIGRAPAPATPAAGAAGGMPVASVTEAGPAATPAIPATPATSAVAVDPLHDSHSDAAKEAEQLAALSRVVQQQQDTITRQATALMDLQKRFVQQERQLQAATASAVASNASEAAQVEPYFPKERVQQELDMLHKVEAQIEEVSTSVAAATAALPQLTQEQQAAQVRELARADQLMGRLSRVAAAISLRTSDPLTEGGHDPVAELRHYYGNVASNNVTLSWQDAVSRQSRPTAASLGIEYVELYEDMERDLDTMDLRLEFAISELAQMQDAAPCKLALVTTWYGDLWGLRREILPWITYHAQLGVSRVYVLYEGGDMNTLTALHDLSPYVRVMLASAPLANSTQVGEFEAWLRTVPDSHIKEWSSQPGNYHLMTMQGFAATKALQLAREDNVSWLIHMDPDELLHPGAAHTAGDIGGAFSLLPELCGAPDSVPSIRFVNVEGVPEAADLTNRYEQVTLFRSHRHLVPPAAQPYRYIFKQGHADAWLHLYTNGKSAVRPDAPGVTQGGPHVFLGPADKRWVTPDNPHGLWRPVISNSTLVLHYAYATPGDVAVKAGRSCPPHVVEGVLAGNSALAAQCFVLDIDQRAFMAAIKDRKAAGLNLTGPAAAAPISGLAASGNKRELLVDADTLTGKRTSSEFSNASWPVGREVLDFFWGELALSEGAPFECLTPDGNAKGWCSMTNVGRLKSLLISSGLMMRLHAPSQAMKGIEAAIEQLIRIDGREVHKVDAQHLKATPGAADAAAASRAGAAASKLAQERKLLQDASTQPAADTSTVPGAASSGIPTAIATSATVEATPVAPVVGQQPTTGGSYISVAGSDTASSSSSGGGSSSTSDPVSDLPASGSAAATEVLAHNDNAVLSSTFSSSSTTANAEGGGSSSTDSEQGEIGTVSSSNAPISPEDVAHETGMRVDEAAAVLSLADQISKDVVQQVAHAEQVKHVPKSAIRDKLLLT